jgi:hypothetical protein
MDTIDEIKTVITKMSREELLSFRHWFDTFDAGAWDRQFEDDVLSGKLDELASEALMDLKEGRCTDL